MGTLKNLWEEWKKIAKVVGEFQAKIIFTVFYFLILWMVGLPARFFSDVLELNKPKRLSMFIPWEHASIDPDSAGKQY